jgi:hypothetical protein
MRAVVIQIARILLGIAILVLLYWGTIWVLGLLGFMPPERVLTAIFVVIGLLLFIAALSGRFNSWWGPTP